MIKLRCLNCDQSLSAKIEDSGKTFDCPNCKETVTVPPGNLPPIPEIPNTAASTNVTDEPDLPPDPQILDQSESNVSDLEQLPPPPLPKSDSAATHDQASSKPEVQEQLKSATQTVEKVGKKATKVVGEQSVKAAEYVAENIPQHAEFLKDSFLLFYQRRHISKVVQSKPTEEEVKILANNEVEKSQYNLTTWRRSMLFVGMVMITLTALLTVPDFFENINSVQLSFRSKFALYVFPFLMLGLSAFFTWKAYLSWVNLKRSRYFSLRAAVTLSGQLLLLSILPLATFENIAANEKIVFGVEVAFLYGILFSPVIIGLVMGLMRGCLAARVLNLKQPVFASMLIVASWLGLVIFLLVSGFVVQLSGSFLVAGSFGCLLALVGINTNAGYQLKKNLPEAEVIKKAAEVESSTPWLIGIAFLLAIVGGWELLEEMEISLFTAIKLISNMVASYCLLTVAFCDLVTLTSEEKIKS